MKRGALPRILLLLALPAFTITGCAELSQTFRRAPSVEQPPVVAPEEKPPVAAPEEKPPVAAPEEKPPAAKPPTAPPAARPPAIPAADRLFAEGMTALQEGGQERALELFSAAWREKPGHPGVAREFDRALIALKKNGDAAYSLGKWEDAGKRWMGTLRFFTHPAANPGTYPFTRSEVQTRVDRLTALLTEKALTEYRRGEIAAAIADWKTILSYDPKHEEATRSIRTATEQLETLKNLPPGK